MVATLLDAGGLDPTVVNGGIIHRYGSNARIGAGGVDGGGGRRVGRDLQPPARDGGDRHQHRPRAHGALGVDRGASKGFLDFVSNIPFYGLAVCCTDHPEVQALVGRLTDRRVRTFGFNAQADVRATQPTYEGGVAQFDVMLQAEDDRIEGLTLPMPGDHNVSNALAAIAVARHLGIPKEAIKAALAGFAGVNRRSPRWAR
jgi:UDP-N-acetylmuramate--alanine ligase